MALETGTFISDLVSTNPVSSDNISQGDDHIRLLKATIKATFPNVSGAVTPTHTELNKLVSTGSPTFAALTLTDVDPGATAAPVLELDRNSASPAANDAIGAVVFSGRDSAAASTQYARIDGIIIDPTNLSEDGALRVRTMSAGTMTEALRVDENGKLLIGTTSYLNGWNTTQNMVLAGTGNPGLNIFQASAGTSPGVITFTKSRGTNPGDATVVLADDSIGVLNFSGSDGTSQSISAARISAQVDGTPGLNDMPGRLVFLTTADGAAAPTERMRITNAGRVGIGVTPTTNLLEVNGAAQATTFEVGAASDTTISRSSAGIIAVEGVTVPLNSITNTHTAQDIELGHATDTTISRAAAGVIAVEGNRVPSPASQANGDILYRGATNWERLAAGTSGQVLQTNGAGAAPSWVTASSSAAVTTYTSGSGNWTIPSGKTFALVRLWGGGGSGGRGGATSTVGAGGGGGAYYEELYQISDLGSPGGTVSYSVGAGGTALSAAGNGNPGGNSTFGTATAYGGGGGAGNVANSSGGAGGGEYEAGATGTGGGTNLTGASFGGGFGGNGAAGGPAVSLWGGGGGSRGTSTAGGRSVHGGGGGGAGGNGAGGTAFGAGGNGGAGSNSANATAGSAPSGGGGGRDGTTGNSGAGGNGRIEVWVW